MSRKCAENINLAVEVKHPSQVCTNSEISYLFNRKPIQSWAVEAPNCLLTQFQTMWNEWQRTCTGSCKLSYPSIDLQHECCAEEIVHECRDNSNQNQNLSCSQGMTDWHHDGCGCGRVNNVTEIGPRTKENKEVCCYFPCACTCVENSSLHIFCALMCGPECRRQCLTPRCSTDTWTLGPRIFNTAR